MRKRAMSTGELGMIVILILGFSVIIYFIFQMYLPSFIDKEACHQSVIYRGLLPSLGGAKNFVPLKCQTEKICITGVSNGKCKEFEKERVTRIKVKNINQIEKAIATSIADCWSMMGKGEVLLSSEWFAKTYGFGGIGSSCTICSRIAFDEEGLKKAGIGKEELGKMDVMLYMATHLIPGGNISYLEFLGRNEGGIQVKRDLNTDNLIDWTKYPYKLDRTFDFESKEKFAVYYSASNTIGDLYIKDKQIYLATGDILVGEIKDALISDKTAYKIQINKMPDEKEDLDDRIFINEYIIDGDKILSGVEFDKTSLTPTKPEIAIMFMQVSAPTKSGVVKNTLATLGVGVGGSFAIAPIAVGKIVVSAIPKLANPYILGAIALGLIAQQANTIYNRGVTAGYCGDVSIGDEAREGCSVVRTIDYNVDDLKNYCSYIESIP